MADNPMKVYILIGESVFQSLVYAATLDIRLKQKIKEDYQHDYPKFNFFWQEFELLTENQK